MYYPLLRILYGDGYSTRGINVGEEEIDLSPLLVALSSATCISDRILRCLSVTLALSNTMFLDTEDASL